MRLSLLALLLLSTNGFICDREAPYAQREAQYKQQQPSSFVIASSIWRFAVQEPQAAPERREPYNAFYDCLYRAYLIATILGVIGALVGIGVIYLQTKATQEAASAALLNAQAVVNAERAWLMVELRVHQENMTTNVTSGDVQKVAIAIHLVCRNDGKSIAWITEKWADAIAYGNINPRPDFSDANKIFQHAAQPIAVGKDDDPGYGLRFEVPNIHTPRGQRKPMLIYGYVKYRTIFGRTDGETRFGYTISPMNSLERLPAEFEEYNRNA